MQHLVRASRQTVRSDNKKSRFKESTNFESIEERYFEFRGTRVQASRPQRSRFGNYAIELLASVSFAALLACQEQPKMIEPSPGIYLKPYSGEIVKDEKGDYQATRFYAKFSSSTSMETVQMLASDISVNVVGYILSLDLYVFEVDDKNYLADAMDRISKISDIDYVKKNYYVFELNEWDNDSYAKTDGPKHYGLWWSRAIELSKGLDLLNTYPLEQVNVAVLDNGFEVTGINGQEVRYIVDSGIKTTDKLPNSCSEKIENTDFKCTLNLKWGWDFADWDDGLYNREVSSFDLQHGHHTSTFIASVNNGMAINGVASNVQNNVFGVVPIKIYRDSSPKDYQRSDLLTWTAALAHVNNIAAQAKIGAVNISSGSNITSGLTREDYEPIQQIIDKLVAKKVAVVVSAGNGNRPACEQYPAALYGVISIGGTQKYTLLNSEHIALGDLSPERKYSASNYAVEGKCVQISAPAEELFNGYNPDVFGKYVSGTSFSSPMIAGTVIALKAMLGMNTVDRSVALNLMLKGSDTVDNFPRLNFYKAILEAGKYLKADNANGQIPPECKSYDRFTEEGKQRLDLMDAYGQNAILYQPNVRNAAPIIYNFDSQSSANMPFDTTKYSTYDGMRFWNNEMIFNCNTAELYPVTRVCRYDINSGGFEEITSLPHIATSQFNYWNGTLTYPYTQDVLVTPEKIFSHNYKDARPSMGIDIPKLTGRFYPANYAQGFFNSTSVFIQSDVPSDHLYLYDPKNGVVTIPEYKGHSSRFSQYNQDAIYFGDSSNNIFKLDFKTRKITQVNIPNSEISFGLGGMFEQGALSVDNGKLMTFSSTDSKKLYVWDVTTGKKVFEMKVPPTSILSLRTALKGGFLTVHTEGDFRRNNTPVSGTRTYSCPIK